MEHGPFRWSRNPIYLGVSLWLPGLAFALNTLWLAVASPLQLLYFSWVITQEERYLEHRFGDEYLSYKARVRRWI